MGLGDNACCHFCNKESVGTYRADNWGYDYPVCEEHLTRLESQGYKVTRWRSPVKRSEQWTKAGDYDNVS